MEKRIINTAMSRGDRVLRASAPDYVRVDEYTADDLMAFAVGFGALINYFNLEDEIHGDWTGFFAMDNALLLSYILSTNVGAIEDKFSDTVTRALATQEFPEKFGLLRSVFGQILYVERFMDFCWKILWRRPTDEMEGLKQELAAMIRDVLRADLRKLKAYDQGAGERDALDKKIGLRYEGFSDIWELGPVRPDGSIYRGRTPNGKIDCSLTVLPGLFTSSIGQLRLLQQYAAALLPDALAGPHRPHIALYLAFLRLSGYARDRLNTFTGRYRDFYYQDILRQRPLPASPDAVYLALTLVPDQGLAGVPKGTLFLAGSEEDGAYAADSELCVSPASISHCYTIYSQRQPLINGSAPLDPDEDCGCTPPPEPVYGLSGVFAGEPQLNKEEFATLGSDVVGGYNQYATLGFSIASEILLLGGGTRDVVITLVPSPEARRKLMEYLMLLSQATGLSPAVLARMILDRCFTLYASTADGWLPIEKYEAGVGEDRFTVSFRLSSLAPAISPLTNPETGEAQGLPTVKFLVRQDPLYFGSVYIYPMSFLDVIRLARIEVSAEVTGLPIEIETPYPLFGGIPVHGSYFDLAPQELFSKTISSLSIDLQWYDLPTNEGGFKGYYKEYTLNADGGELKPCIGNTSFKVHLRTVNPGSWTLDLPLPLDLYGEVLSPQTTFRDLAVMPLIRPDYYKPSDSVIRIELSDPPYAFGNDLYAINLMNAIVNDLPFNDYVKLCQERCGDNEDCLKKCIDDCMCSKKLVFPSTPYVPQLAAVTVGYKSGTALDLSVESTGAVLFRQLYPFGGYENSTQLNPRLLPAFDEGNLILGLSSFSGPLPLNLLFELSAASAITGGKKPEICWSYLSGNRWSFLPESAIFSDSTNVFTNTGIVGLKLPAIPATGNTILSPGYSWLRASTRQQARVTASTKSIYPHALMATRASGSQPPDALPAYTITETVENVAGIETILQPMASFGGMPAENAAQLVVRTSERINHKQRAILPIDYQRLVLQQFPQVLRVKCLPHQSADRPKKAGKVLVVVLVKPLATPELLMQIRTYLTKLASPFVEIEVVNPVYVRITVNCTVRFVKGADTGGDIDRLNAELIGFLSPWRDCFRPEGSDIDQTSEAEIARFIQTRPYVAFLETVELHYDPPPASLETNWYYLIGAEQHVIRTPDERSCEQ